VRNPNLDICGTASFNSCTRFAHCSTPTSSANPGDVAAWPRQVRHNTPPDWISEDPDDWYCAGGRLNIERKDAGDCDNQIWIATNYLTREVRIRIWTSFAGISLDQEIAAFDIAKAEQLLEHGRDSGRHLARLIEISNWDRGMSQCDPVDFPSLLCLRPSHCSREHQTSYEVSPPHGFPPLFGENCNIPRN
jgi:hypothetical protein